MWASQSGCMLQPRCRTGKGASGVHMVSYLETHPLTIPYLITCEDCRTLKGLWWLMMSLWRWPRRHLVIGRYIILLIHMHFHLRAPTLCGPSCFGGRSSRSGASGSCEVNHAGTSSVGSAGQAKTQSLPVLQANQDVFSHWVAYNLIVIYSYRSRSYIMSYYMYMYVYIYISNILQCAALR